MSFLLPYYHAQSLTLVTKEGCGIIGGVVFLKVGKMSDLMRRWVIDLVIELMTKM